MDLTRLLNMILRMLTRRLVKAGVDKGIDMASGVRKPRAKGAEHTPEERQHQKEVQMAAMRARHDLHLGRDIEPS